MTMTGAVSVHLLADRPDLMAAVGDMRWREWRLHSGREERSWWVEVTRREAGRDALPVTFVAVDARGEAVGAVGLGEFDLEERRDRSPWVLGMIVRADRRGEGIGQALLARLDSFLAERGDTRAWVATGDRAVGFYQRCGWRVEERLRQDSGSQTVVLSRQPY
jgi:GNAT superfamily N-acetyltransferase